jgi:purine-nucleoside phosphorylase
MIPKNRPKATVGEAPVPFTPDRLPGAVRAAVRHLRARTRFAPEVAVILGSGLGGLADHIEPEAVFPYAEIPGFGASHVHGHKGQLLLGTLEGRKVVAMQGRFHFYEGYPQAQVTLPMRVFHALGIRQYIVTNAAGGMNRNFRVGDLMIIEDVINLMFSNPLRGVNDPSLGTRFPDMSQPFSPRLKALAETVSAERAIKIVHGTYVALTGPSYETRAEIRFLVKIGGDAVGMSTAPEVIVARQMGDCEVLGISFITNKATGEGQTPVTHEEVLEAAKVSGPKFVELVRQIVRRM